MKKIIKINESHLRELISKAVRKALKENKTSYGLEYEVLPPEEINRFEGYDKSVAQNHINNYGCIIIDKNYGEPIDNEYDLEEIAKLL